MQKVMKSLKEKIAVMQAALDGKKIEVLNSTWGNDMWGHSYSPKELTFDWGKCDYRIKEEPEYVPFDITDAAGIVGKIFRNGNEIYGVTISGVILLCFTEIPYEELLTHYPFADGSLCGKLKQP
jgi:hypothetical protein